MSQFNILRFIFYSAALCHYFQLEQFLFSQCICAVLCCCCFLHCFKVNNFFVIITLRASRINYQLSWWRKHSIPVVYRVSVWYDFFSFESALWFHNLIHFHLKWQTFQFESASQYARHIGTWTECSCWKSIWVLCSLKCL